MPMLDGRAATWRHDPAPNQCKGACEEEGWPRKGAKGARQTAGLGGQVMIWFCAF